MKLIYTISSIVLAIIVIPTFFSFTKPFFPTAPPPGYTGAPPMGGTVGAYCTSCHSDFAINTAGGGVATAGLPTIITLGASYNFSTTITHGVADRERFGFAIKAVDATGAAVGTFTTTNPNAGVDNINREIGHRNAFQVSPVISYTYDNLTWTAPTVAPVYPITFYIAGNAGNFGQGSSGDYIYSSTVVALQDVVPISLSKFSANQLGNADVTIQWRTEQEINADKFEIEKSSDGYAFSRIATAKAQGFSNAIKDYNFIDKNPSTKGEYIYYRLKMIDKDGTYKYSNIAKVSLLTKETIVKNVATIHNSSYNSFEVNILSPNTQSLKINWVNSNGQLISEETKTLAKGSNSFTLRNNKIGKGEVLYLQFKTGGLNKTYTLVN
jgi:hypothetical protein